LDGCSFGVNSDSLYVGRVAALSPGNRGRPLVTWVVTS